jgi:hypothetical protein
VGGLTAGSGFLWDAEGEAATAAAYMNGRQQQQQQQQHVKISSCPLAWQGAATAAINPIVVDCCCSHAVMLAVYSLRLLRIKKHFPCAYIEGEKEQTMIAWERIIMCNACLLCVCVCLSEDTQFLTQYSGCHCWQPIMNGSRCITLAANSEA